MSSNEEKEKSDGSPTQIKATTSTQQGSGKNVNETKSDKNERFDHNSMRTRNKRVHASSAQTGKKQEQNMACKENVVNALL